MPKGRNAHSTFLALALFSFFLLLKPAAFAQSPVRADNYIISADMDAIHLLAEQARLLVSPHHKVSIEGITVQLGDTKQEIIELFSERFEIDTTDRDYWLITSKTGEARELLASLAFKGDRVVRVSKYWLQLSGNEWAEPAIAILEALAPLNGHTGAVRSRSQFLREERDLKLHRVQIDLDKRSIVLTTPGDQMSAQVFGYRSSITDHYKNEEFYFIGELLVWAGMTKETVASILHPHYLIIPINKNMLLVSSPANNGSAIIFFENDRLKNVSTRMAELQGVAPILLFESLYRVVGNLNLENLYLANVRVTGVRGADFIIVEMRLVFGVKEIVLLVMADDEDGHQLALIEMLRSPDVK